MDKKLFNFLQICIQNFHVFFKSSFLEVFRSFFIFFQIWKKKTSNPSFQINFSKFGRKLLKKDVWVQDMKSFFNQMMDILELLIFWSRMWRGENITSLKSQSFSNVHNFLECLFWPQLQKSMTFWKQMLLLFTKIVKRDTLVFAPKKSLLLTIKRQFCISKCTSVNHSWVRLYDAVKMTLLYYFSSI